MMDDTRERNLEFGLFALAFGLALMLRLLRLGELPLSDDEARWALQSIDITRGVHSGMGPQPAYVVLTSLVFFIMQTSNFAARLVPAVFGAALVWVPFVFRERLGSKAAVLLGFLLAFDPGFLALSRLAGSPVLAVAGLLFAWGAWRRGSLRAAGIWLGLALLSGPMFWPGVLSLGLTYIILRGLGILENAAVFERQSLARLAAYAAGTYLLLGSLFLLATGGLGAGLAAIPAYFGGWLTFSDVPAWRALLGLASYELMAVLLALVALVRGLLRRDELVISLGVWLAVSLVLILAYPARQVSDLAWVLLPLLALAAVEAASYLVPIQEGRWETIGMAVFTAAILVFAFMNYSAIALSPMDEQTLQLRGWVLLGSLALLAVSISMVAFGWSVPTAVQGGLWGTLAVLGVYTLSSAMASGGLRTYRSVELWPSGPHTAQAATLISQMNDLSRGKAGVNTALDVTLVGVDSPALRWILRDWPLTISSAEAVPGTPAIVIASTLFSATDIETTYRGQDFAWRAYPIWDQGLPADWLRWSLLHEFPKSEEKLVLWVRNDVFVDWQNNQ